MDQALTVADWIDRIGVRFAAAGLHYGHGTNNARDEAAWLVLHAIGAPLDGRFEDWGKAVSGDAAAEMTRLAEARCAGGAPLAYLIGKARFAGLEFEVTPDVLVPRSPIAELILDGFRPWRDFSSRPGRVLDLCTGCGCIAVATAHYLPETRVDATDISPEALAVAARNVQRHGLAARVRLLQSDLFQSDPFQSDPFQSDPFQSDLFQSGWAGRYDLIVANPPYVPLDALADLPGEYRAEPSLGLVSGVDGLDAVLQILAQAPDYLAEDGILVCEVGESEQRLAAALPSVPFLWLEFAHGGSGVFLLGRAELEEAQSAVNALIGKRKHVA
jgi:ribosomal protein L3 glutamine methyltransferase